MWVIDTGLEHFVLGVIVGVLVSAWVVLMYGLWTTSRPLSEQRVRRDLERKKAEGRTRINHARHMLDDFEKEFGVITEQEMHEIKEELT